MKTDRNNLLCLLLAACGLTAVASRAQLTLAKLPTLPVLTLQPIAKDFTSAQIARFAPVVFLHPAEQYRPMDPLEFIRLSRFRHHRSWESDQGFHRVSLDWVTTDSHAAQYYDMPSYVLNSYTLHSNGDNRRPCDSNCGSSYNVFLETDGNLRGTANPNGQVPVFYTYRRDGDLHRIQYRWFFGYNQTPVPGIAHQGDWEHVTVYVRDDKPTEVFYAAHEDGTTLRAGSFATEGVRPVVFLAWGTHAAYATTGLQTYPLGAHLSFVDHTEVGVRWDTGLKLLPLASQPWKDYAGAWGQVGNLSTTTGPLGPWHKRDGK